MGVGGARRLQGRRGGRERKEESGQEERGEDPKGREGRRSVRLERAGRREDKVSAKDERWRTEAIASEGRGGSNEAGGWKRESEEERERGDVQGSGKGERVCLSCLHLPPLLVVKRMWKPDKVVAMFWQIPCRSQKLHFDKNANWKLGAMTVWLLPAVTNDYM